MIPSPGPVVLFGSGETAPGSQSIYDAVMRTLQPPVRVGILETPAGFQLNSADVAGAVGAYLEERLQNYRPQVTVVPARKKGTPYSPDDPEIVAPLLTSQLFFLGPGSPTYAVRQLQDSLAWHIVQARHRLGHAVVLASAATIAASAWSVPVYEIYKVGEDVHWVRGLDLWAPYGLSLVFVPHWDNSEGGAKHDTSRCFMGLPRFEEMRRQLPQEATIVGIDEHTALVFDMAQGQYRVLGRGGVTILREGGQKRCENGCTFDVTDIGAWSLPPLRQGIPDRVWDMVQEAEAAREAEELPPEDVLALAQAREEARVRRDWAEADGLRDRINALGWQVQDTPQGAQVSRLG